MHAGPGLLPPLPRWVLWSAVPVWLGLVTVAAWLRTLGGVASDVAADVIGSAAGVAFAATGAAAVLSRWQHRRLLRDLGEISAGDLNILADHVADLFHLLLSALTNTVPLVHHARADDLTVMVQPPAIREATELVLDVCLHGSSTLPDLVGVSESAARIKRQRAEVVEALGVARSGLPEEGSEGRPWLTAQIVAPALCWYDEDEASVRCFLDAATSPWPKVPEVVGNIASVTQGLTALPVPGMRDLALAVGRLEAVTKTKWQPTALEQLEKGELPLRDVVKGCRDVLAEAVYVTRQLTTTRADFVRALGGEDLSEMMARHQIQSRDSMTDVKRWFRDEQLAARVCAAWDALDDVGHRDPG